MERGRFTSWACLLAQGTAGRAGLRGALGAATQGCDPWARSATECRRPGLLYSEALQVGRTTPSERRRTPGAPAPR
jgi:hypothetical protein